MTQSIIFRNPLNGETTVSPGRSISIILASDDQDLPVGPPDVYVQGAKIIDGGIVNVAGATIASNDLLGYDIDFEHADWEPGHPIAVRVVADDGDTVLDESWSFTVVDNRGPVLSSLSSPLPGEVLTASPATIVVRLADERNLTTPPSNVVDFSVTDADAEYQESGEIIEVPVDTLLAAAQQLYSATADFEGREGASITIDGARRVIDTVHGANLITYSGAQILGNPVTATVYQRRGLDVWIDGILIVSDGIITPSATGLGWGVAVATVGSDLQATLTPPGPYSDGDRVRVGVRVADGDATRRNTSVINYEFTLGDAVGPTVTDLSPAASTRGISLTSPASDLQFDITDPDGVDATTLNVTVNGTAAVTAGVAAAVPYAGCTVTPITNGHRVVLVRSTSYTDGELAVVDIEADDLDTVPVSSKTSYIVQYGATLNSYSMNVGTSHLPDNDILRLAAFDLSETSFGNPRKYRHQGYGHDGYKYVNGERTGDAKATWWTAFGDFPLSGWVAFTADGWSIIDSSVPITSVFATFDPLTPGTGWSVAGNASSPFTDGGFGKEDAVVAICDPDSVIVVDFSADVAHRYSDTGREEGATGLDQGNLDQSGGTIDGGRAIDNAPHEFIDVRAWQTGDGPNRVIATASDGVLTSIFELSSDALEELDSPPSVTTRVLTYSQWVRLSFVGEWIMTAGNNSGQAAATLLSLEQLANGNEAELFVDDLTTPALPSGLLKDSDLNNVTTMAFALEDGGGDKFHLLVPFTPFDEATRTVTDLGLSGLGTTRASAIALERGTVPDLGHLYAAVSEDVTPDSRAVRWREHSAAQANRSVVVIASGGSRSIKHLATIGEVKIDASRYVRGYMEVD